MATTITNIDSVSIEGTIVDFIVRVKHTKYACITKVIGERDSMQDPEDSWCDSLVLFVIDDCSRKNPMN